MDTEPLKIPRELLIKKIEDNIADAKKKWDEARAVEAKREEEKIALVREALDKHPVALLMLVERGVDLNVYATGEKFVEFLNTRYPDAKPEFVPDRSAAKMVRVLTAATNPEIDVSPSDNYYDFL